MSFHMLLLDECVAPNIYLIKRCFSNWKPPITISSAATGHLTFSVVIINTYTHIGHKREPIISCLSHFSIYSRMEMFKIWGTSWEIINSNILSRSAYFIIRWNRFFKVLPLYLMSPPSTPIMSSCRASHYDLYFARILHPLCWCCHAGAKLVDG